MRRQRGSLAATLLWACALSVVALAIASALLAHYNLAEGYRDRTSADLYARAGVEEFILRSEELQQPQATENPEPLLALFRGHENLLTPTTTLPARVTLLLDGPYRSTDNSLGSGPAPSCFDRGGMRSVPPYSFSLVLRVEAGHKRCLYEALVQQRWPYALTAPGPIRVAGAVGNGPVWGQGQVAAGQFLAPTTIKGNVLAMQSEAIDLLLESSLQPILLETSGASSLYTQIATFSDGLAAEDGRTAPTFPQRLSIGGPLPIYSLSFTPVENEPGEEEGHLNFFPAETSGALVDGDVDLYENAPNEQLYTHCSPDVRCFPGSEHRGTTHAHARPGGGEPALPSTRLRLSKLFQKPDTSAWPLATNPLSHRPPTRMTPQTEPPKDLVVSSDPNRQAGPHEILLRAPQGKVQLNGNLVPGLSDTVSGKLILENCALAVNGNVTLLGSPEDPLVLRAIGSTLIVDGTLIINNGEMDAESNGMVLWCQRFLIKGQGRYNGVIVSRDGGAFFGTDDFSVRQMTHTEQTEPQLRITGGVLMGAHRLTVKQSNSGSASRRYPDLRLRTSTLSSVQLEYGPQYMRTLNQFGALKTLLVEWRANE